MKKLKLRRETISILTGPDLDHVLGGNAAGTSIAQTTACPVLTNSCAVSCQVTIPTTTTSIIDTSRNTSINPSGG